MKLSYLFSSSLIREYQKSTPIIPIAIFGMIKKQAPAHVYKNQFAKKTMKLLLLVISLSIVSVKPRTGKAGRLFILWITNIIPSLSHQHEKSINSGAVA